MDGDRFAWIAGQRYYIPSKLIEPGDRVRLLRPKTNKPEFPAVVKVRDMSRLLLSVHARLGNVLKVVHWSRVVLEDDVPVQRELYETVGGAA